MNDTELDELLDTWKAPSPHPGLRTRLQVAAAAQSALPKEAKRKFFSGWKMLLAGAAAVVVIFVLVDPAAISQKINPPYMVESEIIVHPGDATDCIDFGKIGLGSNRCWPYSRPMHTFMTSYNNAGSEVVLSWSDPGKSVESWLWTAKLSAFSALEKIHGILAPASPEPDEHAVFYFLTDHGRIIGEREALLSSGCRPVTRDAEVVGAESILGYPTTIGRIGDSKTRLTLWMAPTLSCFALRATEERQQPDGSWTVMSEKKALKVSVR